MSRKVEVKKELFEKKEPFELMVGSPHGSSEDALMARGTMIDSTSSQQIQVTDQMERIDLTT